MRLSISLPPVCPKRLVDPSVPAASTLPMDILEAGRSTAHSTIFAGKLAEKCGPAAARRVTALPIESFDKTGISQNGRFMNARICLPQPSP